jgi:hypothetical protein
MPPQIRAMDKPDPRRRRMIQDKPVGLLAVIISLLLYGCAVMDREESVQASGVAALQSDDEGERTLAAIRALFPQRGKPAPPVPDFGDKRSSESKAPPWPPDWLSAYLSPPQSSEQESDLSSVYVPSSSLSKPRTVPPDVTVRIPRAITPAPRSSETASPLGVPAYMVPAPIGSAYPGSSRCVPDLLGGQRCHAN